MKVQATRLGYYGNKRRYEGQAFLLSDPKHFSKRWMTKFDPEAKPAAAKPSGKTSDKDKEVI